MNTLAYLDAAKLAAGISSDYRLAKVLGATTQAVSGWRAGVRQPDALMCYRIAQIIGADPALVVADIERERAERAGKAAQASAWREWVEKLGGVAAALVLGTILSAPSPAQSRAVAGVAADSTRGHPVYYVKS